MAGSRSGIRVLHVDDDPDLADVAATMLERRRDGFTVETAASADEALDRLADGGFDCIVSDHGMPCTDGLEFLETVRDERGPLPFVLFTGEDRDAVASEALARGADDYVRKGTGTAQYDLLANRVENAVRRRRATQQGSADDHVSDGSRGDRSARLVGSLPIGMYRATAGPNGEVVATNAALADIFGAECADDVVDREVREFHQDGDEWDVLSDRLTEEEAVRDEEVRAVTLDGERIWISVTAVQTVEDGREYVDGIVREVTDRKERERQLRRFRSAVDHAGHAVLITDTDGTIEYVNDAFEDVTGYTPGKAVGESPAILQSGEHDRAFYEELWGTILDGEIWEGEVVNERADGERYVIDQTIAPITDGGEITGFVAVNRDITERKERELDLAFLKRAIDQAGIGIGTYGADGYATYVNQQLADLFGVDRERLRDRHMADLDPELDRARFGEYWESFEDGEHRVYDTTVSRADTGDPFRAGVVTSRVTIDGEPYQVNTVRDITDRKERERQLRRFRSAVDHAGHAVLITDTDGTIEYVNDAFEATSGYAPAEAIGRTPAILKSGEHDPAFYEELWGTILDGEIWEGEVVNERADGERYVVDQTIAPITDGGEITGFVAVNRDVTDLKQYERELEGQNERLKEYGHTVAHDLRNPLNLLRGELDRLRTTAATAEQPLPPETVRDRCDEAVTVVERMERLVDELLTMAEQGQLVLDYETIALETLADTAWEQVESPTATLAVEDATVEADPDRLRELLSNLFRNAVEHAGDDVRVHVGPLSFADGFYVEDDGPGVPADKRHSVFDRGYTTAEDGTGFGLAIVDRIAEAHGWSVSITDGSDGGARFEFRTADRS